MAAEVKGRTEEFYLPQIKRAAVALSAMAHSGKSPALSSIEGVVPLGIKVVRKSTLWVIEFEPVADQTKPLLTVAEGMFELVPPVAGVE